MSGAYMPRAKAGDWRTPAWLVSVLRRWKPIALDPCAAQDPAHQFAHVNFTGQPDGDDGLTRSWVNGIPHGLIYANPPYGRVLTEWARKAVREHENGAEVVLLTPSRTDTRWWQTHVSRATAVCFLRGRLRFEGAPASAPFPSALVYFGLDEAGFADRFREYGQVVLPEGER